MAFLEISWAGMGSFAYKTDRGLGFTATRAQVLRAYGEPIAETSPGLGVRRLIYDRAGIAFVFNGNNLRAIDVFRPGTAARHWHLL